MILQLQIDLISDNLRQMPEDAMKALLDEAVIGLRERKKRETRQQISDTATIMFMRDGFDAVKVSQVAAAVGVSEKTVYNYFPTKESLLLDQEDEQAARLASALRDPAYATPIDAVLALLQEEDDDDDEWRGIGNDGEAATMFRRFTELIAETPSLRAAWFDMYNRFADVAATAIAERSGVSASDPEVRIFAHALIGLHHVHQEALVRYASTEGVSVEEAVEGARAETARAAAALSSGFGR